MKNRSDMYEEIGKIWGLCYPPKDDEDIHALLSLGDRALTKLAVLNYPYASTFLTSVPAHPVKAACEAARKEAIESPQSELNPLRSLAAATKIYFSDQGCIDLRAHPYNISADLTWQVLFCNFFTDTYRAQNGVTDFFYPSNTWSIDQKQEECKKKFGIPANMDRQFDVFGGRNPKRDFASASNIIFSNGDLDPWIVGGITEKVSDTSHVILIAGTAHGSDL
jgi:lysosomal Pro-X carboxypeptidase